MSQSTARRVLEIEAAAIANLVERIDDSFDKAVDLLFGCSGRIVVTGMGKSGIICQKLAATFSSTGNPAYFMHPAEAIHGDLGMLRSGDVLLAISNSGETEEIVRLLEMVRRIGASIVAMTGAPQSSLAQFADVHLDVSVDREACSLDLAPTASTTASLAMGDALAIACYERRGLTASEFAHFHPGGRLGRRLLQVEAIMHSDTELPTVPRDASMLEAVKQISEKRLGMTCVVDDNGDLCGILTDGDLRRRMLHSEQPLHGSVEQVMVASPLTIGAAELATAALRLMEQRKITSLPVIDADGALVGVVQIHDLWRTEMF